MEGEEEDGDGDVDRALAPLFEEYLYLGTYFLRQVEPSKEGRQMSWSIRSQVSGRACSGHARREAGLGAVVRIVLSSTEYRQSTCRWSETAQVQRSTGSRMRQIQSHTKALPSPVPRRFGHVAPPNKPCCAVGQADEVVETDSSVAISRGRPSQTLIQSSHLHSMYTSIEYMLG